MKIILTKTYELHDETDVQWLEEQLTAADENNPLTTDCLVCNYCDDVKVGYNKILLKAESAADFTFMVNRSAVTGMAIDGKPVVLHGPNFRRIGCIRTEEEFTAQTEAIKQELKKAKADLDADAQRKIDAINEEYMEYLTRVFGENE